MSLKQDAARIIGQPEAPGSSQGGGFPTRTGGTANNAQDFVWDHSYWVGNWLSYWGQRVALVIDADQVEEDVENMPFRITEEDLPSAFWAGLEFTDGRELRFTTDNGYTLIPHDIEAIDTVGQTLDVWVAPPLATDVGDTTLYLYYDSPGARAPSLAWAQAVWVEYVAVWHLSEAAGNIIDRAGNGYDLTNDGAEYGATGKVDDALTFVNANSDFLQRDSAPISNHPFSLECWFKTPNDASTGVLLYIGDKSEPDVYWILYVSSTGQVVARSRNTADGIQAVSAANYDDDTWHHAAGVFASNTSRKIFVDGVEEDEETTSVSVSGIDRVTIGALGDSTPGAYHEGEIDEVRIAAQAFSDEWWETSFNTMQAKVYTVGSVEVIPDGDHMTEGTFIWDVSEWDGPDDFDGLPHQPPAWAFVWDHSNWDGPDLFG